MALTKIDSYEIMYSGNTFPPRIWLKSGNTFIGQLIFQRNGDTLPADSLSAGQVNLFYHLENFAHCIDILRNESPVFLLFNSTGGENGIKTTTEVVGEDE